MINIISLRQSNHRSPGPNKVLVNATKGLDIIHYPYVINRHWNATKRLWIQWGRDPLHIVSKTRARVIIGPNVGNLPGDISHNSLTNAKYLLAGPWVVKLWLQEGFNQCPIVQWPVGIDTDYFHPAQSDSNSTMVMVYHKRRSMLELFHIQNTLSDMGIKFFTVPYGAYNEEEFRDLLRRVSFVIWHGCSETQGIALQEAMACGVPILVCDATSFSDSRHPRLPYPERLDNFEVTSAPYFSDSCGMKITNLSDLRNSVIQMRDNLKKYQPRSYILANLRLDQQAIALVNLWEDCGLSMKAGLSEKLFSNRRYRPPLSVLLSHKFQNLSRRIKGDSGRKQLYQG